MLITFPIDGVKTLFQHADECTLHRPAPFQMTADYAKADVELTEEERDGWVHPSKIDREKIPPCVWLIADDSGVFLMSNGFPGLPDELAKVYSSRDNIPIVRDNLWIDIPLPLLVDSLANSKAKTVKVVLGKNEVEIK